MKTILITGASGFIGSQLVQTMLHSGDFSEYKLVTLSSAKVDGVVNVFHKNYTFSNQDFIDANINSVDIVIHAGAFIPKCSDELNDVVKCSSNIQGTLHLINNLPNIPSKFIFISTVDVYKPSACIIDECSEVSPNSLYGLSKLYCERMLESWAEQFEVKLQNLRLGHIYGPGEDEYKKLIPITIKRIINGEAPQFFSSGEEKRSFLYISDLCQLIINSVGLEAYMGPINVVSKNSMTVKDIIKCIASFSTKAIEIVEPECIAKGSDLIFNTCKVEKLLGGEKISIEDGLAKEYDYFNSKN